MEHQIKARDPMWEALLAELLEDGYAEGPEEWEGAAVGLFSDLAELAEELGYHALAKRFTVPERRCERRRQVLDEIMELMSYADALSQKDKFVLICRPCVSAGKDGAGRGSWALKDLW